MVAETILYMGFIREKGLELEYDCMQRFLIFRYVKILINIWIQSFF